MAIVRTLLAVIHVAVILAGREKIVIKVNWLLFKFSQLFILRYPLVYRERCHSRLVQAAPLLCRKSLDVCEFESRL